MRKHPPNILTGAFLKQRFASSNVIHAIVLIYQERCQTAKTMTQALQTHGKGINEKGNWRFKVISDTKRDKISKKIVFFIQRP